MRSPRIAPAVLAAALLAAPLAAPLAAQHSAAMDGPPPLMAIFIEQVKPFHAAAHERNEQLWSRAMSRAKSPSMSLAMTSSSGPADAWFMTGYASYDAMQKEQAVMASNAAFQAETERLGVIDNEHITGARQIYARYLPELSIPGAVELPKQRYFRVTTYRVRPGHGPDFDQHRKLIIDALRKAGISGAHFAVYQVQSGMPGPAYLVLTPMKSMAELDPNADEDRRYREALGDANRTTMAKLASDAFINVETNVFAVSPKMSYVTREFAAVDSAFWTPKPAPVAKVAQAPAKKDAARP
jgi:hypothetical protein